MNGGNKHSGRRAFLRQMATAIACGGSASIGVPLAMMATTLGSKNHFSASGKKDYRALVCVYFCGGNDAWNLLVPTDRAGYAEYANARGALALRSQSLLRVNMRSDGEFGMHPSCVELQVLFNAGHLAAVANIGALLRPTTAASYAKKNVPLPAQLFSHADAIPARSRYGNINLVPNRALSDLLAQTFAISPQKNIIPRIPAMPISEPSPDRDLAASATLAPAFPPDNRLASQLQTVAQTIQAHAASRNARHIFFVPMRGFDLHSHLLNIQPGQFRQISQALAAFYRALEAMNLARNVTLFTMSEFARTLQNNGSGADHAWGSLQLVMGGAINGGRIYGEYPALASNAPQVIERGTLVPTTSIDQLAATLGKWIGIGNSDLHTIFPNLGFFSPDDLALFDS